ncbi:MAG TPA: hypothetical protein PK325_13725 [Cyclobacteriaceae bacterium]|nr:hypothetical protein [Cyclobacteriaceae bacterium]HMV11236.1 hypothetical protein [Cyclobacteriaceae bacterium]HMV91235.1 hypothetical protein [Cyclobacteriaceae bacterium]HMW99707.1 hypothetical protein [Cyclobacteriaceae bacterium]HMX51975.1 hypothetical protein [Cyclobacteriaceae bacterium]
MEPDRRKRLAGVILPVIVLAMGVVLLVLNVVIEDEPGAVPLLIIAAGAGWLVIQLVTKRKKQI